MERLRNKIAEFLRDELYVRNRTAAYNKNKNIISTVLIATLICHIVLLVTSFAAPTYTHSRTLYIVFICVFAALSVITHFLSDKTASWLAYILHFLFVLFCAYNSAVNWPGDICVMVLAELFIFATLLLDKNIRIIALSALSSAIYLCIISTSKAPYYFIDELVNIICFAILSNIVGIFTRKIQLQNFENIQQLRLSKEHYELALKHSTGLICEYDVAQKCVIMTQEVAAVFGAPPRLCDVPYGSVKSGNVSEGSRDAYIKFYEEIINGHKTGTAYIERLTVNGWRWQRANFSTIFADDGSPVSAIVSFTDITEQHTMEKQQKEKAELDGLTGVYNRATVETLIVSKLSADSGTPFALFITDMDNLKSVNDSLGHPQGDKAIKLLSQALKTILQSKDILGRIGGDEFIAFVPGIETNQQMEKSMERFKELMSSVCVGDNNDVHISASTGIILGTTGKLSFEELYAMADKALYLAKNNGKNQHAFYANNI